MDTQFVLKHLHEDFVVEESGAIPSSKEGAYSYVLLEKSGFTTFDAMRVLADHFRIPVSNISAAGLKDEDAITKQIISILDFDAQPVELQMENGRWIRISAPLGFSDLPQEKGALSGNRFTIVIRNLSKPIVDAILKKCEPKRYLKCHFVNYFDYQRFGLPGSNYRTAEVGQYIYEGNIEKAIQILAEESAEVEQNEMVLPTDQKEFYDCLKTGGTIENAFAKIAETTKAFYVSSFFSKIWNQKLSTLIAESGMGYDLYNQGNHPLADCKGVLDTSLLTKLPSGQTLNSAKYSKSKKQIQIKDSYRYTVCPVKFFVMDQESDKYYPGKESLQVQFFLPSGCYATLAIRQLVHYAAAIQSINHTVPNLNLSL